MIATGTDIKPLEIVFFMRQVRSRELLRADEGPRRRGSSTPDEFQAVTPDAKAKTHFIIVDAVGLSRRRDVRHAAAGPQEDRYRSRSCWKRWPSAHATRMCSVPLASRLARLTNELSARRPEAAHRGGRRQDRWPQITAASWRRSIPMSSSKPRRRQPARPSPPEQDHEGGCQS